MCYVGTRTCKHIYRLTIRTVVEGTGVIELGKVAPQILKCLFEIVLGHLILMQIFHFSRRFFSQMLIGITLSSLDLLVLQTSSGAHLKGRNPIIVVKY